MISSSTAFPLPLSTLVTGVRVAVGGGGGGTALLDALEAPLAPVPELGPPNRVYKSYFC